MGPLLHSLVNLQSIEMHLRAVEQRLRKNQQSVRKQEHRIEQLQAGLHAKREEIKLTRLQSSKLELDLKARDEEIGKLRVALNAAKTNKDYSAILSRINVDKADNAKLEDQILRLMTHVDGDQNTCREIEAQIEAETQKLADIRNQVAERNQEIEAELHNLKAEYEKATGLVPVKELTIFKRLAERFDGEVLAEVNQPDPRRPERQCGGCFMTIPLEVANALMSKDELIMCPSCGRILVLDKNPMQQPASHR